ncbi:MAG TPA: hypothetical protein DEO88_06650 [Syntrophobacteraceae bacterium]|nr:hypothetical protein [Syntrophobacteraceae bacterium]
MKAGRPLAALGQWRDLLPGSHNQRIEETGKANMPTIVYIISGFLGSGKTTVINSIIDSAPSDIRIIVLVNEFGNISIDAKLIKANSDSIVDLSGGCVCCDMFIELISTITFVLETHKPEVILIETTGLAIPQEVARLAASPFFEGRVVLGGIITVVNAAGMDFERYPLMREQLRETDVVVLNKVDLLDAGKLKLAREKVRQSIPSACVLYETSFGRIQYGEVLAKRYHGVVTSQAKPSGKMDSTSGFSTICLVRDAPLLVDKVIPLYKKHGDKIIRSKGFLLTEKGTVELQFSTDGIQTKMADKPMQRTEIVLIVREEDRELIEGDFRRVLSER